MFLHILSFAKQSRKRNLKTHEYNYRKVTKERKSGATPLFKLQVSFDVVLNTTNMINVLCNTTHQNLSSDSSGTKISELKTE